MIGGHPKILIIRLSAIGDVVRVLPAATAIRQAYPSAQIDWVVESAATDILQENPSIDQVFVFERTPHMIQSIARFLSLQSLLRDQRYDIAFDFHGIFKSGLLLFATRAARRISFAPPRARELSHRFANERILLSSPIMNRVDENLELCNTVIESDIDSSLSGYIDKQINEDVFAAITKQRSRKPWFVLLHAPVDRPEKRWPNNRFAELVNLLLADGRFDVALTHGPGQENMLAPILAGCDHRPIVPPPCATLREFAALVSMASLYIGVDTGPMHIAAAVGTPVIAVFGGTDPRMHSPVGAPSKVLGGVTLSKSTGRVPLEEAQRVLESVSSVSVFRAAVDLLDRI